MSARVTQHGRYWPPITGSQCITISYARPPSLCPSFRCFIGLFQLADCGTMTNLRLGRPHSRQPAERRNTGVENLPFSRRSRRIRAMSPSIFTRRPRPGNQLVFPLLADGNCTISTVDEGDRLSYGSPPSKHDVSQRLLLIALTPRVRSVFRGM